MTLTSIANVVGIDTECIIARERRVQAIFSVWIPRRAAGLVRKVQTALFLNAHIINN